MSIEYTNSFQLVKRIAKVVAPEFRVFATSQLQPEEFAVDLKRRTIEVGEGTGEQKAITSILFQLGHVILSTQPDFKEHSGQISPDINEARLINKLVREGHEADQFASNWASSVLVSTFGIDLVEARKMTDNLVWSEDEWRSYYSS